MIVLVAALLYLPEWLLPDGPSRFWVFVRFPLFTAIFKMLAVTASLVALLIGISALGRWLDSKKDAASIVGYVGKWVPLRFLLSVPDQLLSCTAIADTSTPRISINVRAIAAICTMLLTYASIATLERKLDLLPWKATIAQGVQVLSCSPDTIDAARAVIELAEQQGESEAGTRDSALIAALRSALVNPGSGKDLQALGVWVQPGLSIHDLYYESVSGLRTISELHDAASENDFQLRAVLEEVRSTLEGESFTDTVLGDVAICAVALCFALVVWLFLRRRLALAVAITLVCSMLTAIELVRGLVYCAMSIFSTLYVAHCSAYFMSFVMFEIWAWGVVFSCAESIGISIRRIWIAVALHVVFFAMQGIVAWVLFGGW